MEDIKKITQKWGFGMAPISKVMQGRYDYAVESMLKFISDGSCDLDPDYISELKGMFNRCVRKDQWDWFSVHQKFGFPPASVMRRIAGELTLIRKAVLLGDRVGLDVLIRKVVSMGLVESLMNFQQDLVKEQVDGCRGWIYILSTREQPNVLKIGMTRRSVVERVKEINSDTGVLFPFSARQIFRVDDAPRIEKEIFAVLDLYRIRKDREFFAIEFSRALDIIKNVIR
ncbi:GIY-YIG nuclease family protein [Hymenobacter edaphi]|uniref:Bacteriophage T5 Orf172 DNA-binding domain-containing protein n=1 Tax=Hymenobacter edaphi TaxID=2211146 RepID=A0A328BU79_9BACT|nr:GIY-YIG nuclease family protein [Hymenobacter edaphi]RAK69434.1 hypothetical protein DLM85_00780 [Hymenobacter edaphi]